jgi:hypothetical protein
MKTTILTVCACVLWISICASAFTTAAPTHGTVEARRAYRALGVR